MENGNQMQGSRPQWGSRLAFVIAAAGSAIGLGNIWKFPYMAGENGGGAFVLVYLATIVLVGLPLMTAEIMIGKGTQLSPVPAFQKLYGKRSNWILNTCWRVSVPGLSVLSAFLILSFYSVVCGWTLHYLLLSMRGAFLGKSPDEIYGMFSHLYGSGLLNLCWHLIVMLVCTAIIYRGLRGGIERATKILMPTLLLLMLILLVNSLLSPGAAQGIAFLFKPDFHRLTPRAVLEAVGHGFFTLSLAMGAMITYGSYLRRETDLARPAIAVVAFDTIIALLAGMVIFPIVFSYGFEPDAGPGLVFKTLPVAFSRMPGGMIMGSLFFLLLFLAALTSAISLLEVVTAYLVDCKILKRHSASIASGAAVFAFGILSALSGGPLSKVIVPNLNKNLFDTFDYITTNWFLPIGGLFIAIFVGWIVPETFRKQEYTFQAPFWWRYRPWKFFLRWIVPLGILDVFLYNLGLLKKPLVVYLFDVLRLTSLFT